MPSWHLVRLGLSLNASALLYEILDLHNEACQMAKQVSLILD